MNNTQTFQLIWIMIMKETKVFSSENLFSKIFNIAIMILIYILNILIASETKKSTISEIIESKISMKIKNAHFIIKMMMTKSKWKKITHLNLKEITLFQLMLRFLKIHFLISIRATWSIKIISKEWYKIINFK